MIQAIDRAAMVLNSLQGARHLGISELAATLGLPPSTVHGIVKSLQQHGLVAKEPHGTRYMLGPTLLKLSNVYLDSAEVRVRGMRWADELSRRTGLATRLGTALFDEVIILHHGLRPDGSQQMFETGLTVPAHASAMGKVLLAYEPDVRAALPATLRALTGDTVTDPEVLDAQLREIVATGIGTERDEAVLGDASVAAPVVDRSGGVVAAVALVFPSSAFPADQDALNNLRESARNISRELGAPGWPPSVGEP